MKRYHGATSVILLILADLLCLNLIAGAGIYVRYYSPFLFKAGRPLWPPLLGFLGLVHLALLPSLVAAGAYRTPRQWGWNEALPVALRALVLSIPATTVMVFVLRMGVLRRGLVRTPSRFIAFWTWAWLLVGLTGIRLLYGRVRLALYRRGIGTSRALIVGEGEAAWLAQRIRGAPWLGEQIVGLVSDEPIPERLGAPSELAHLVARHQIDTVWLAPSKGIDPAKWLPDLLWQPQGNRIVWRVLPSHFAHLVGDGLPDLKHEKRERLYHSVSHRLSLPTFRVAMIGSRGVPANYSGVETYVEQVGRHLVEQGAEVAVYCHSQYVSARGMYRGMSLRFVPTIPTKHLETIVHTFLATVHVLFCTDEIVHYHALGPATLSWLPRLFGRKTVVTVQGLDWQRAKWGRLARAYLRMGEWASARLPHRTIVVSTELVERYRQRYRQPVVHIPNGFAAPERRTVDRIARFGLVRGGYILFVGRLVPEKGCHILLRAFAQVETDKQLVFAGRHGYEDGYYRQIEQEAQHLENVHLLGFVRGKALQELYSNAYLVVHPSEVEGLSISLLESLSYGNCVLGSDIPENVEALGPGSHTFRSGDSRDLAAKLQQLIDDPQLVYADRRRAEQESANMMGWLGVASATQAVYASLISHPSTN